jgi:hypothetical protein
MIPPTFWAAIRSFTNNERAALCDADPLFLANVGRVVIITRDTNCTPVDACMAGEVEGRHPSRQKHPDSTEHPLKGSQGCRFLELHPFMGYAILHPRGRHTSTQSS